MSQFQALKSCAFSVASNLHHPTPGSRHRLALVSPEEFSGAMPDVKVCTGKSTNPMNMGLHSSTFSSQRERILWDTRCEVGLSLTKPGQVQVKVDECKPLPRKP